jgi:hypothetical protein
MSVAVAVPGTPYRPNFRWNTDAIHLFPSQHGIDEAGQAAATLRACRAFTQA